MMRKRRTLIAATAAVFLAVAASPRAAPAPEIRSANLAEVKDGSRIGWLPGHSVVNDQSEMIGTVDDLVVGRDLALFVVLQIGDFLGFDTYLVAVPFKTLVLDGNSRRIRLPGATRKALRNFPKFSYSR
jgi:hypothetical protein